MNSKYWVALAGLALAGAIFAATLTKADGPLDTTKVDYKNDVEMREHFREAFQIRLIEPGPQGQVRCDALGAENNVPAGQLRALGFSLETGMICIPTKLDAELAQRICSSLERTVIEIDLPKQTFICGDPTTKKV